MKRRCGEAIRWNSSGATWRQRIIATARASARKELADSECRYLLGNYGIDVLETRTATTDDDAVREADELGYAVVLQMAGVAL